MGEAARVPRSCSLGRPLRSVHGGLTLPRRASSPPLWDPARRWRARKVDPSSEDMVVAGKGGGGSQDSPVPESRRTQEPLSQSGPWFPELSNRQVAFGDAHGPCQPKHASTHRHAWNGAMGLSLHTPPRWRRPCRDTQAAQTFIGLSLAWLCSPGPSSPALPGGHLEEEGSPGPQARKQCPSFPWPRTRTPPAHLGPEARLASRPGCSPSPLPWPQGGLGPHGGAGGSGAGFISRGGTGACAGAPALEPHPRPPRFCRPLPQGASGPGPSEAWPPALGGGASLVPPPLAPAVLLHYPPPPSRPPALTGITLGGPFGRALGADPALLWRPG